MAQGKAYAASPAVGPRVLFLLAAEGRIVRGRPLGSWTSTLYRWAPMRAWLPGGLPELDADEAAAELVRRWLRAFGPGTYADLKWWTGWTAALLKRALARVAPVEVALQGGASGARAAPATTSRSRRRRSRGRRCCRRSIPRRWAGRSAAGISARTASGCSTAAATSGRAIWWDGRIVGGWAQRRDGEVVLRAARGRRRRCRCRDRRRGAARARVDRRRSRDAALPHAAGARARPRADGPASRSRPRCVRVKRRHTSAGRTRRCAIMRRRCHPSRSATSPSASARSRPSSTSASTSRRAGSPDFSAPTAPARARRCARCSG